MGVTATDGGRALQRGGFDDVEPGDIGQGYSSHYMGWGTTGGFQAEE